MSIIDPLTALSLLFYASERWEFHISQGISELEAFVNTVNDSIAKFVGVVAEGVVREFLQGLKDLVNSIFRLW